VTLLRSYLLLLVLLSAPLWLAASFLDATKLIPVRLPLSALQFLCVLLAVIIVTRRSGGSVRALLERGLDFARITKTRWRVGVFILMPLVVLLSYGLMIACGVKVSAQPTPLLSLPVLLLVYGISGYCEQLGWTAIMTDALLTQSSVIQAGLVTGLTWASWHIIPFIQTHNTTTWIVWQCVYSIVYRVLLTRIYVATNRSVFATIALHATYNTAFSLMPYYGSSYRPMYMTLATLIASALMFVGEGSAQRRQLDRT
jgi:hypothetical protein